MQKPSYHPPANIVLGGPMELLPVDPAVTELVASFGGQKVLLVGDFMLDSYVIGDAERISPEAPVPVLKVVHRHQRPGGAGSVAAALTALGADVLCCGLIGSDPPGRQLQNLLHEAGCRTSGLLQTPDRPTITKTRMVGLAQHRHPQQLIRVDEETAEPLSPNTVAQLLAIILPALQHVDVVCLEDYNKGLITEQLAQATIAAARQAAKPLLVDPAAIPNYHKYRRATLITPNRTEFELLTGQRTAHHDQLARLAQTVVQQLQLDALVITLDRDGALLVPANQPPQHVPTRPRTVYDNTGAGDVVLATLAAAIAAGGTWLQAVQLANIAGGLEVERFGCVPITREEILSDLLAQRRHPAAKLRTLRELLLELKALRHQQRKIVFTNGCFDILHPGHIEYFEFCRQQGDTVVVGLDSDQSVRALNKGPDRPIFNQFERAQMLSGLQAVDFIVFFDDGDPTGLIRAIRPDVLVKGQHWTIEGVVGREIVEAYGGLVRLAPIVENYSTSAVIHRIRQAQPTTSVTQP